MRCEKTGYAVEQSARGSVSVTRVRNCYKDRKTGYAVEEYVRGRNRRYT